MPEPDPIRNDRRRARRRAKLPANAACVLCTETTPEVLLRANRSLLEAHHVLGEAIDGDLTVPLCLNCHRKVTEGQLAAGVDLRHQPRAFPEAIVSGLLSLGLFLVALGKRIVAWAYQLAALNAALDEHHPDWRELPEAWA